MPSKNASDKEIPLIKALANADRPPASPLEVFKVARRYWLEGKRITIRDLASEVNVSRVTLYRWVGSKDRLIEEILWSFAKPTLETAAQEAPGTGIEYIVEVVRRLMTAIVSFEPMRHFIYENPKTAIRVQSNDPTSAHGRIIQTAADLINEQAALGHYKLPAPAADLAEMIICTSSALLFAAIIGDRSAAMAIEHACIINRMLMFGMFAE